MKGKAERNYLTSRLGLALLVTLLLMAFTAGAVMAAKDKTPPTGSLSINQGAEFTRIRRVSLSLWATDNSKGTVYAALSNDGRVWTKWEKVFKTRAWDVSDGDGHKTIYVMFRDGSGNVSRIYADSITLDRVAPKAYDISVETHFDGVQIRWRTDEPTYSIPVMRREGSITKTAGQLFPGKNQLYTTEHEAFIRDLRAGESYIFAIQSIDRAGNSGMSEEFAVQTRIVDRTPPKGSITINNGAETTNSSDVMVTLQAWDDSQGAVYYALSRDGRSWEDWRRLESQRQVILSSGEGTRQAFVRFRDEAGNVSEIFSDSIIVDMAAPQIYGFRTESIGPSSVRLIWQTNEPAYCTVQYSSYRAQGRTQSEATDYYNTTHEVVLEGLQSGNYSLRIEAQDRAGNRAKAFEYTLVVAGRDTNPPSGSIQINNGSRYTIDRNVTLTLAASDNESGVVSMQLSNDGWSWSPWEAYAGTRVWNLAGGDGTKTVYVRFRDSAGNVSPAYSATIEIDTRQPEIRDVRIENIGINTVRIRWRTSEPTFGTLEYYFSNRNMTRKINSVRPGQYAIDHMVEITAVLPSELYYFTIEALDEAGNRSLYEGNFRMKNKDTTPPQGRISIEGGREYTNDRNVSIRVEARDDDGGRVEYQLSNDGYRWSNWAPAESEIRWNLDGGDGSKTIQARFRDEYGNVSSIIQDSIILDTRLPGIANVNVEIMDRNSVRINWRTDEPATGVVNVSGNRVSSRSGYNTEHSVVISGLNSGEYRFTIEAVDRAGNTNRFDGNFRLSPANTAPPTGSLRINNGAHYTNQTNVMVSLDARDDQGGRVEYQLSNDGRSWTNWAPLTGSVSWNLTSGDGAKTVFAQFRDNSGNVSQPIRDEITLDTRAPRIYDVQESVMSATQVRISWRTDEPAASWVNFGMARALDSRLDASRKGNYATEHSVVLDRLSQGAEYRYQIQAVDQAENQSGYEGTFRTGASDSTPPTGSLRINNGARFTNQVNVVVNLDARDAQGGRVDYQLSNDGRSWTNWAALTGSVSWNLAPGDGVKTVFAQFRDSNGNVSQPIRDEITLDTRVPRIHDVQVSTVSATQVRISWRTDEPAVSWVVFGMARALDHRAEEARKGNFGTEHSITLDGLSQGTEYRYQIQATDQADNQSGYEGTFRTSGSTTPPPPSNPPTGTLRINGGAAFTKDRQVTLELAANHSGGQVDYQLSNDGNSWSEWRRIEPKVKWDLTSDDGIKSVYARFRDHSGNVSQVVSGQITLDTRSPKITNINVEVVNKSTVRIRFKTNEPAIGTVALKETDKGGNESAKYHTPNKATPVTEHEIVIDNLKDGREYRFTIQARDQAGNLAATPDGTFTIPVQTGWLPGFPQGAALAAGMGCTVGTTPQTAPYPWAALLPALDIRFAVL